MKEEERKKRLVQEQAARMLNQRFGSVRVRGADTSLPRRSLPDAEPLRSRLIYKPGPDSPDILAELKSVESMERSTKLYKYLRREHAYLLVGEGSTRIGTLFDFRRDELAKGIADTQEGILRLTHEMRGANHIKKASVEAGALSKLGLTFAGDATIQDVAFIRQIDHPDVYVWCCSNELSQDVMDGLEGTDTCVEITNAGEFFDVLTRALNEIVPVEFLGFRNVDYVPRDQTWDGMTLGRSAAFIKEHGSYGVQKEVRAVWRALKTGPLKPEYPASKDLVQLCRQIDVPKRANAGP